MPRPSANQVEAALDHAEAVLDRAVTLAVQTFLRDAIDTAISSLERVDGALVAAGDPGAFTLGTLYGYWGEQVNTRVTDALDTIWRAGYRSYTGDGRVTRSSLDAFTTWAANVSDRLVQGLTPPLPDDAFNSVRTVITQGAGMGWSTKQTAQRIAKTLAWETNGTYWRQQLAQTNTRIDSILDPLGKPGSPAREAARMNDAVVRVLQADRATIIKTLDREQTHWATRANLIARTESTGAYNFGALTAMQAEGVTWKEWLATSDARTRVTHRVADGQVVRMGQPFLVGGYEMQHPGAPTAPPAEVCNCRCAVVQAEAPLNAEAVQGVIAR